MPPEEQSLESTFEGIDYSMAQYFDYASGSADKVLFDDILTVEERYQHANVINKGGMKKILKTTDVLTNRPVAKATLIDFEDLEKVENFLREARLTAALEHPNIIPVYDVGVDDTEGPYFIMKLAGGENLGSLLKKLSKGETDCSVQDLMEIFLRICDAIAYAHSKGIIHLDLKPENIQIGDYGEVLVCDWGLAKVIDDVEKLQNFDADLDPSLYNDVTLDGYIKGSPGFMAPEQVKSELGSKDQRTDVYALGGILYSMLTYSSPMKSSDLAIMLDDTCSGNIKPPSERFPEKHIPPSLEAVAMKALNRDPEQRYASVSDLRKEIQKWVGGFATDAEKAGFAKSLWLLLKRHKVVSSLLFIFFLSSIFAVTKIKQNEKKAIISEKKAILNEKKALETLSLYKEEKGLNDIISEHAVEQVTVIYNNYVKNSEFAKAISFLDKTLEFQKDNETLHAMKGEAHFYRQEYNEALNAFRKAGKNIEREAYRTMQKFCPAFIESQNRDSYINAADFAEMLLSFKEDIRKRIFSFDARKFELSHNTPFSVLKDSIPALKNHLELCRLIILRSHNPKISELNFTYTLDPDGINLDLSNTQRLEYLYYIRHLPLKSLNLKKTHFWRQWIFNHYYLKSVNIQETNIREIKDISRQTQLREIILSKDQFDRTSMLRTVQNRINFKFD